MALTLPWACFILSLVPAAYLVALIQQHYVDVPYWDQWELVPFLHDSYEGKLSFNQLLSLHNEHRPFFARLIMIPLARLTGWDIFYELMVNVGLALATFLILAYQLWRLREKSGDRVWPLLLPILSALVFSLTQWENWLWGWQIQIFLHTCSAVAGLLLISRPLLSAARLAGAVALGFVATYSFATGLIFWPAGLLALFLRRAVGLGSTLAQIAVWGVSSVAAVSLYLYDYHGNPGHPAASYVLGHPSEYVEYVLAYLGAPIMSFGTVQAIMAGLAGGAAFVLIIALLVRGGRTRASPHVFSVVLGLYAMGSALMTGIGRAGFGIDQATAPRYVTIAYLFWAATIVMFYSLVSDLKPGKPARVSLGLLVCSGVLVAAVLSSANTLPYFIHSWEQRSPARDELMTLSPDTYITREGARTEDQLRGELRRAGYPAWSSATADELYRTYQGIKNPGSGWIGKRLYPNLNLLSSRLILLREHRLSVFREMPP